jgi:hypothetical protein
MALDKATYYRQRVEQLRQDAALQKKTIAELEQRLFMIEAELSAFESALQLETPQDDSTLLLADNPADPQEFPSNDTDGANGLLTNTETPVKKNTRFLIADLPTHQITAGINREEPPSSAATLRSILGENSGGMTPTDIMEAFAARGQTIKREYLYALLSRLRSRGELKRRSKKYSINEGRLFGREFSR